MINGQSLTHQHILLHRTPPINGQCRSIPIKIVLLISIRIKKIDLYWEVFWINSNILIGIDRYWSTLGIDRGSPEYNEWIPDHSILQSNPKVEHMLVCWSTKHSPFHGLLLWFYTSFCVKTWRRRRPGFRGKLPRAQRNHLEFWLALIAIGRLHVIHSSVYQMDTFFGPGQSMGFHEIEIP